MIITIDGPVATGKSTIAKLVAEKLHYIYFDTGAMYRCFTWYVLENHIDYTQEEILKEALELFDFEIQAIGNRKYYLVAGKDVTADIRGHAVTQLVSTIAAIQPVRDKLVFWQRSYGQEVNVVFEGRDLGSVVFPEADLKIYLTGEDEVRAQRRFEEIQEKYPQQAKTLTFEQVLYEVRERDKKDKTRKHSPLVIPQGAKIVDTTHLSQPQVVEKILSYL